MITKWNLLSWIRSGTRRRKKKKPTISDEELVQNFPDGPVVKNPPLQCREQGFDPWSGTISHAEEHLSLYTTTTEPTSPRARLLNLEKPLKWETHIPRQRIAIGIVAIFFRIDWFNLLAVQGTLKSLLQHCPSLSPGVCSNSWPLS